MCLCLWSGSHLSMQQQGAADSNEWADGVVSAIAASGGFSSLAMRGCVSTKAPDAEGGVMAAREPTKPARNSEQWAFLRRPCIGCWRRPEGILCALTFDLTGLPKASPVEGRVRSHSCRPVQRPRNQACSSGHVNSVEARARAPIQLSHLRFYPTTMLGQPRLRGI